jgi:hypothetical protein
VLPVDHRLKNDETAKINLTLHAGLAKKYVHEQTTNAEKVKPGADKRSELQNVPAEARPEIFTPSCQNATEPPDTGQCTCPFGADPLALCNLNRYVME